MRNYLVNINYLSLLIRSKAGTLYSFPPVRQPVVVPWSLYPEGPFTGDIVVYNMVSNHSISLLNTEL